MTQYFWKNIVCVCIYIYTQANFGFGCALMPSYLQILPPKAAFFSFRIQSRCVRLEAALLRMVSVWYQSTARAIREQTDHYAFESLSRYFDVIHWSFCTAPLKVEHTYCLLSRDFPSFLSMGLQKCRDTHPVSVERQWTEGRPASASILPAGVAVGQRYFIYIYIYIWAVDQNIFKLQLYSEYGLKVHILIFNLRVFSSQ